MRDCGSIASLPLDGPNVPQELQPYFQDCDLLRGEIGCYASHLALWHLVAKQDQPALICEDDVLLADDLGALLRDLLAALPRDWDVVRLLSVPKRGVMRIEARLPGERYPVQYSREPTNAGAALISPAGARKLIEPRGNQPPRRPVPALPVGFWLENLWCSAAPNQRGSWGRFHYRRNGQPRQMRIPAFWLDAISSRRRRHRSGDFYPGLDAL